jgi:hypothetical protein
MPATPPATHFLARVPLVFACALALSCRYPERNTRLVYVYPLEDEVKTINTAAYPEGSYRVKPGDTPKAVAAGLGVDFAIFAEMNGVEETTVLKPGDLLVVPRVAYRTDARPEGRGVVATAPVAPPQAGVGDKIVGSDGLVRALSAGTVTGVFRKYTSLGDVVIIENENERVVYSGAFEPAVAKGATVRAAGLIGTGARPGGVKARFFDK